MAVTVYWDEGTENCLRVDLQVPWNWCEFKEATQLAKDFIEKANLSLGYIVDVRLAGDLPPVGFLTHSRNALQDLPVLPMVFVANTTIMQIIFQPIQQIFRMRRHFYFARNIEEARELLKQNTPEDILH